MTQTYAYHRPKSVDEVLDLVIQKPGAVCVAGGTDLFVQLQKRQRRVPSAVISLRNVAALTRIEAGERIRIGAATPMTRVIAHPEIASRYPALVRAMKWVGSRQIQNVATLGGNLCNASPAADTAPALLAYSAVVELASPRGTRELSIEQFMLGVRKTALAADEIVAAVLLPEPSRSARATFIRLGRVSMDLAIASLAALVELDGDTCTRARVAAGSVAPVPLRLFRAERVLEGGALSDAVIQRGAAAAMAEVSPIDDLRSTAEYRRDLVGAFFTRAIGELRGAK